MHHNVYNYFFYIYYLENKEKTSYNGVESYISRMAEQDNNFWFPIGRALALGDLEL